jgi:hypothetical protein
MYRGEPPLHYYDSSDLWITIAMASANVTGGSSSTGRDADNTNVHSITPWASVHSPGAFICADPKSTVRNVNNNPQKNGYVFGRGSMNDGYYSLNTKDAWIILHERLSKKEQYSKSQLDSFDCANCLCWGSSMTQHEARQSATLEEQWQRAAILAAYALVMTKAPGPSYQPTPDDIKRYLKSTAQTTNATISDQRRDDVSAGMFVIPMIYDTDCLTAAGCGGGGNILRGGACGGGAACGSAGMLQMDIPAVLL